MGQGTLVPWVTSDPKMQWEESWGWRLSGTLIPGSATCQVPCEYRGSFCSITSRHLKIR